MLRIHRPITVFALALALISSGQARAQQGYVAKDLVTQSASSPGFVTGQTIVDGNLMNPWGMSFSGGSPFWVSDQASSFTQGNVTSAVATLYSVSPTTGAASKVTALTVNVPNEGGAAPNASTSNPVGNGPTGQVSTAAPGITTNAATDFQVAPGGSKEANFIFANLDGSISAWKGGTSGTLATIEVHGANPNAGGPSYTGLAIGNLGNAALIYAANQNGGIDVFNSDWSKNAGLSAKFADPNLPTGYTAFDVQNLHGIIYVTFANQNAVTPGGIVDAFTTDGTLIGGKELIDDRNGLWLDQAWGLAIAPSGWGKFGGDLLVGNNDSNGFISAFDPTTGAFMGFLTDPLGNNISENGLWALSFGNGSGAGSTNTLFFTAGANNLDGVFGAINAVPEPSTIAMLCLGGAAALGYGYRRRLGRRN